MAQKGSRESFRFTNDEVNFQEGELKTNLNYIDMPIRVGYKVAKNFRVTTGIEPSLLVGGKIRRDAGRSSSETNATDSFKTLDLSANIGVEYNFTSKFGAAFVYDHGFTNVNKNDLGGVKTFNRGLKLSLFYKVWK